MVLSEGGTALAAIFFSASCTIERGEAFPPARRAGAGPRQRTYSFPPRVSIGNIQIGMNERPLVIPEIGINHGGSLETAKLMVDAAYRAGARIVKHQTHVVEDEMSQLARKVVPGNSSDSIYDIMARCALSEEEEYELMQWREFYTWPGRMTWPSP